jgi:hypothetical protein
MSIILLTFLLYMLSVVDAAEISSIILYEKGSTDGVQSDENKWSFAPQVSGVSAVAILKDVKAGTKLKGSWIAVKTASASNHELDSAEFELKEDGVGTGQFDISRPENGWLAGQYRIDVYVDGQLGRSAFFEITPEPGLEPPADVQVAPGSPSSAGDGQVDQITAEKLKILDAAHQAGVLTDEEYGRKKDELLSQAAKAAPLDPATVEKLKALEAAHQAGVVSDEEYGRKKMELVGQGGQDAAAPGMSSSQPASTGLTVPRVGGQTFKSGAGFSFWYPTGWTLKEDKEKFQLTPPNPLSAVAGIPTEVYFMYVKEVKVKDLGALANTVLSGYIQTQTQSFFSMLKQVGPASSIDTPNGAGLVYNWETDLLKGLGIVLVARAYIGQVNNCLVTLIGFGPKQLVEARDGDLRSIFTSLGSADAQTPFSTGFGYGNLPIFGGNGVASTGPVLPGGTTSPPVPGLSGSYVLVTPQATVRLTLVENAQGGLSGTLASTSGMQFQLAGQVANGIGTGRCYNNQLNVFFQAQLQGGQLLFSMIEPNANNMPDYSNVQQLTLVRQPVGVSGPQSPPYSGIGPQPPGQMGPADGMIDSGWGFRFKCPAGWQAQRDSTRIVLGSNSTVGNIVIFPHAEVSFQQVQVNMQKGLSEERVQLSLISALQPLNNYAIAGDYAGVMNGQQVKARGIGTFSGRGGGAYILAVAAAAQYSPQLSAVTDSIARGLQYSQAQPQGSDLMQYFAGTWKTYTQMTETTVHLTADGRYFENYVASYGGEGRDQYGNQTMSWGSATDQKESGRWTVRGNRQQGVLTIVYNNGSQEVINYQVHIENGQTFWNEYYFGGILWGRQR